MNKQQLEEVLRKYANMNTRHKITHKWVSNLWKEVNRMSETVERLLQRACRDEECACVLQWDGS